MQIFPQDIVQISLKDLNQLWLNFINNGITFQKKDAEECNPHIFNAPTMVYLTLPKGHTKYSVLDLGGIEMAIMLAAKDHGLDSIPAYTTIMYPDVLRKYLKISDKEDIVIGVALGYEEKCEINEHRSVKLSLDEVCHFFN